MDILYSQILDAIYKADTMDVHDVLSTIVTARNPLPVETIPQLLNIEPFRVLKVISHLGSVVSVPDMEVTS